MNNGDTAWVLASAALVLLMTPGLAFFYGGMVRGKNALTMLMQNYICIGIVSVAWVVVGYTLAFGRDGFGNHGWLGNFHQFGLAHMQEAVAGYMPHQTIPPLVFVAFQLMFAVITPALITGSIADRTKFGAFCVFVTLWSILVYSPVAHWVFSPEGWLFKRGAEDFAGGTVVHINAGIAGVALAVILGKRAGWPKEQMKPHNLPFTLLGAGLLWFGWFGFNAGSALGANQLAGYAFMNTNTATAAAMLAWLLVEKLRDGHATTLGAASGAVAGLVAITPAAGYVSPLGSIAIGVAAGAICAIAVTLKFKLGLDDALDVGGVHLVGGIIGSLMVGLFGTKMVGGVNGVFYGGGWHLFKEQALAVGVVIVFSGGMTLIIGKIIDMTMGLRVTKDVELSGLDQALHAETAYEAPTFAGGGHGTLVGGHAFAPKVEA
jgi:Amt family ammonium transporter